jgi:hypothetical protein
VEELFPIERLHGGGIGTEAFGDLPMLFAIHEANAARNRLHTRDVGCVFFSPLINVGPSLSGIRISVMTRSKEFSVISLSASMPMRAVITV